MGLLVRSLIALSLAFALCASRPAFALDTGDIVVASIKGEVRIAIRGTETPLRAGSVLELPATVRTGRDGAVELRQGATSISVGPETLLEFPALATPGGSIDRIVQPRGTSFYDVGKRGGRKLRIETPFLVGVVKGTQFSVVAQDYATTISLFEGLLEVRSADDSDVIDLHAGEIATRDRAATDISVLKMEAGAKPPAGASGNPGTPSSQPRRPTGDVVGDPLHAGRGHGNKPEEIPTPVVIEGVAGGNGGSVDVGVGAVQVAVDVGLELDDDENDNSGPGSSSGNSGHGNSGHGNSGHGNSGHGNSGPGNANDLAAVVDTTGTGVVDASLGANASLDNGVSVDVGVGLGNTQVNLGADLGTVTDIDLGLDDDDRDDRDDRGDSDDGDDDDDRDDRDDRGDSDDGDDGDDRDDGDDGDDRDDRDDSDHSDHSGSDNSGSGSDNSGPGNLVEDLLGGLTRRSGKK